VRNQLHLFLCIAFSVCLARQGHAQILDDTTRQIYSPATTRIIYEQDFLRGNYTSRMIDTTLTNIHRERHWYPDTAFYQDLGNVGTAAYPILWQFPQRIGARLGKNVFDRYAWDPNRIPYYDTKSPHSYLRYVQGDKGQQVFEAKFTRNISPNWNFGLVYNRISANKQIGQQGIRDGEVDHVGLLGFTHYRNQDSSYQVFANIMHQGHLQIETGGLLLEPAQTWQSVLVDGSPQASLRQASSREVRNTYHLAHFYRWRGEHLKFFHVFNSRLQKNFFHDNLLPRGTQNGGFLYYPRPFLDSVRTFEYTRYMEIENSVGLSGNSNLYHYKVYLKRRDVHYTNAAYDSSRIPPTEVDFTQLFQTRLAQHFAGLETQVNLPGNMFFHLNGEFQFSGDYQARVHAGLPWLSFSRSMISYQPALIEKVYVSNHFRWNNNFSRSLGDQTALHVNGRFGRQSLKMELAYNRITNYVFFNQEAVPEQYSPTMRLFAATLHHHTNVRNLHLDNIIAYTNSEAAPVIQVPTLLLNSKIYYQGALFRNALFGQIGIDTYFNTAYHPYRYMPVTQQFYFQNEFRTAPYPVVDLFLTADIKAVNLFLKVHHVNQNLMGPGYIITPLYPGMQRSIMFGLKWVFFD
jgi:hypothetical protein